MSYLTTVGETVNLKKYADIEFECPKCKTKQTFGELPIMIHHIGSTIRCPICNLVLHFDFRDKSIREAYLQV